MAKCFFSMYVDFSLILFEKNSKNDTLQRDLDHHSSFILPRLTGKSQHLLFGLDVVRT